MGEVCTRELWSLREEQATLGPQERKSKDISTLEGEVRSRPENWCSILLVIILVWWWEEQEQVSFSRLNFPSHSFNFYLWPGLAVHVFPILLPSSWGDPSHPSFCGLSASVRQFYSETLQSGKTLNASQGHQEHLNAKCMERVGSTLYYILCDFLLFSGSVFFCWLRVGRETPAIICSLFCVLPLQLEQG